MRPKSSASYHRGRSPESASDGRSLRDPSQSFAWQRPAQLNHEPLEEPGLAASQTGVSLVQVKLPSWWSYPTARRAGHRWAPGLVVVAWHPCDCPGAMTQPGRGHAVVRCGTPGCTSALFKPRHGPERENRLTRPPPRETLDRGRL